MRILGIETSADDTGVSIIEASGSGDADIQFKILGNALLSQSELHSHYGGIYPNLAKREHGRNLVPVLMECLRQSNELIEGTRGKYETVIIEIEKLLEREHELFIYLAEFLRANGKPNVDVIAVTVGPGLEPALWVGINFARSLALAWNLPIVAVNHLEGHILIARTKNESLISIEYPALAVIVSGGHTELVLIKEPGQYSLLGQTRDDAAGEAFDKSARLIGLSYPGGPEISRLALEARGKVILRQDVAKSDFAISLPRPMIDSDDFDFSFSGLKTAVRKVVESWPTQTDELKCELAREIEDSIVDVLLAKTKRAAEEYGVKTIVVGGGVSANDHLRKKFAEEFEPHTPVLFPSREFSTDNAVMIALAGYFHAKHNEFADPLELRANGNLRLAS